MSRTQRIILIVAISIAVIGGGFLIASFFLGGDEGAPAEDVNAVPEVVDVTPIEPVVEGMPETDPSTVSLDTQLRRIAKNFAERYGSFSNQNDYENLENLETFMTKKMIEETSEFVTKQRRLIPDNAEYYGITTQVLTVDTESFDEEGGSMVVLLTTRRAESDIAAGTNEAFEQNARVTFKKEGDRWLVDAFTFING